MAASKGVVYFAHGKESGPWGTKIRRLAEAARRRGFTVHSPDYRRTVDPDERVKMLLKLRPAARRLALVGSSMGGYVSVAASQTLNPRGLFLMAPALYLPGYRNQNPVPRAQIVTVVHGWRDPVVPVNNAIQFARQQQADLHLLNSAHRLIDVLPIVLALFELFLSRVASGPEEAA
ncbi:MAG: alpha/beta fold hydrolase [Anaerolineae bacterium]